MNKDSNFPKMYKVKLPPLEDEEDSDGKAFKIQCNNKTIDDDNSNVNTCAVEAFDVQPKINIERQSLGNKSKLTRSLPQSIVRNEADFNSIQARQGDGDTIFEKSQIILNGIVDSDSIIDADQSKNYLRQSNHTAAQHSTFHPKQGNQNKIRKAQNIDEMGINEVDNYTENRIEDNETIDIERMNKMAETQQYIENTFKNMIASQKLQFQQQQIQQQQQQLSHDNYEPPQCRICLEVFDEEDYFKNVSNNQNTIDFNQIIQSQNQQINESTKNNKLQNGPLMSPCKCSGSSKYIHEKCLKEWIKQTYDDYSLAQCEVCKQSYVQNLLYEKKFKCNTQLLREQPRSFLVFFIIWLLFTHFCIITTIIILLDLASPDKYVPIFNKNVISSTAIYILFAIDVLCDIACIIIFIKYYSSLFRIKILIDWQIMNFTKHPKEKHPKVIEKFYDGKITKDGNSASHRNVQLQLMMNNSIDNRNGQSNSVHNYQSGQQQGGILSQSQHSRQAIANSSQRRSQRLVRNSSNIQTINFFANMGVSENVLNHFLNQQDMVIDPVQNPVRNSSQITMKRCDSEDGDNEERSSQLKSDQSKSIISKQGIIGASSINSSIRQTLPSPVLKPEININIARSERLQLRKESSNYLHLPSDDRSPDKFKSQSTHFGKADDSPLKKITNSQWKRHVFFAKDQPYEIIVKPSDNSEDYQQPQKIFTPKMPSNQDEEAGIQASKFQNEQRNSQTSLKRFFEEVQKQGNQQLFRKDKSNSILKKVDSIVEVQEEEQDKTQINSDNNQVFRACESFESNNNEINIYQNEATNHQNRNENNNTENEESNEKESESSTPISQICIIKQKAPKDQKKQISTSQRLQDILYQKIQQAHPEIKQQSYINSLQQNERYLHQEKGIDNTGQLFSSINTQINTQTIGDSQSQTTQIYNKSFLSSNHGLPSMQNASSAISQTYSKQQSREDESKNYKIPQSEIKLNETKEMKLIHLPSNIDNISLPQTLLSINEITSEQTIQKIDLSQTNEKQEISINEGDMYVVDLESQ